MVQDRVIFEEKLKRGLVPDGEGGWITIEAAILKEKSRHRQSRLWDPGASAVNKEKEEIAEKEESENLFFEKSINKQTEEVFKEEELLNHDPVEDTAEVDLYDEDEDTAVHEIEDHAPDTTIIEVVEEPGALSVSNETDTVALDRSEVMKDVDILEASTSELDGLADDFGDIIDSFAAADEESNEVDNISEAPTVEVNIEELSEDLPVKINDADIELPPSSDNAEELILDIEESISSESQNQKKAIENESIDEWEKKSGSLLSKILIPTILLISAAVLVAVIMVIT